MKPVQILCVSCCAVRATEGRTPLWLIMNQSLMSPHPSKPRWMKPSTLCSLQQEVRRAEKDDSCWNPQTPWVSTTSCHKVWGLTDSHRLVFYKVAHQEQLSRFFFNQIIISFVFTMQINIILALYSLWALNHQLFSICLFFICLHWKVKSTLWYDPLNLEHCAVFDNSWKNSSIFNLHADILTMNGSSSNG